MPKKVIKKEKKPNKIEQRDSGKFKQLSVLVPVETYQKLQHMLLDKQVSITEFVNDIVIQFLDYNTIKKVSAK